MSKAVSAEQQAASRSSALLSHRQNHSRYDPLGFPAPILRTDAVLSHSFPLLHLGAVIRLLLHNILPILPPEDCYNCILKNLNCQQFSPFQNTSEPPRSGDRQRQQIPRLRISLLTLLLMHSYACLRSSFPLTPAFSAFLTQDMAEDMSGQEEQGWRDLVRKSKSLGKARLQSILW